MNIHKVFAKGSVHMLLSTCASPAAQQLADEHHGVIGAKWRKIPCPADDNVSPSPSPSPSSSPSPSLEPDAAASPPKPARKKTKQKKNFKSEDEDNDFFNGDPFFQD